MIVLDTSLVVAYFNNRDDNHTKAEKIIEDIINGRYGRTAYITDYIFDEVATVSLIRLKNLDRAVKIGKTLLKATSIIEINKNCFDDAWDIFCAQKNTRLSFTDCTTISAMQQNSIENLATFDKDFTKINEIRVVNS
ncbi:PilT protein domain containing protein [Marine Group I thaumarchaeote SCGC AAA799-N04]|uniref:PilT protein domain containing protein n=1 Tax=Marine Group I thaumarchaeote SCGC AAA799-N04 TaxID=1502293 RepID=A0A081RNT8_9ARCH|nr:PilT protein domain containing protein [Marine Group I thaumarchaeote SCGC AAA799-N04]